jgi:hypothetical protein
VAVKKVLIASFALVLLTGCLDKDRLRNQLVPTTRAERDAARSDGDQSTPAASAAADSQAQASILLSDVHYDSNTQLLLVSNSAGVQIVDASNVTDYKVSETFVAYQMTDNSAVIKNAEGQAFVRIRDVRGLLVSDRFTAYWDANGDAKVFDANENELEDLSGVVDLKIDKADESGPHTLTTKTADGQTHSISIE